MANPSPDKGNVTARAPRVEACIQDAMEKYAGGSPGRDLTYYQNVHQDLAPLARELENALSIANARIAELERATTPSPSTAPEVGDEGLPPLKTPEFCAGDLESGEPVYTAEQYRQGQRDAVAADRARRQEGDS